MSAHAAVLHTPVGGPLATRFFKALAWVAAIGGVAALYRFFFGLGAASNLNDGYPWGIWIAFDVVVGTAIGCGGYAIALLVYILNKGEYHPLVRPAILTSLLGYGLAVLAVTVDLGRFWELWKVPIFFWRWTHSPQLEVALCVALYNLVLLVELSPALFEKWQAGRDSKLRGFAEKGLRFVNKNLVWIVALGLLLPTMHQSSLGTMMLLPATKLHPLWFTPWLPLLFLISCVLMGYGVVAAESNFAAKAFGRERETAMLARLGKVAMGVTALFVVFRFAEILLAGDARFLFRGGRSIAFWIEILLHVSAIVVLASEARRLNPVTQVRAGLLLVLAGACYRINTYLVAFRPGSNWKYFPSLPELAITFGIVALELILYLWAVKRFPILAGRAAAADAR